MKFVFWFLTLPLRLFDAVARRFVAPPVDRESSLEELKAERDILVEEIEKPPPPMV